VQAEAAPGGSPRVNVIRFVRIWGPRQPRRHAWGSGPDVQVV